MGLGVMGGYHLRILGQREDVELVALVDVEPERRAKAGRVSGAAGYESLAEAVERHSPDFVCLAAPPEHLPALAHVAIDAGVPALVEKPMADGGAGRSRDRRRTPTRKGVAAGRRPRRALQPRRHGAQASGWPRGDAGRVYQVARAPPEPVSRPRSHAPASRSDLATHDLDVIRYLTGSEVARVYAGDRRARAQRRRGPALARRCDWTPGRRASSRSTG